MPSIAQAIPGHRSVVTDHPGKRVRLKFTRFLPVSILNLPTELRCADGMSDAYGGQRDLGFQQVAAASSRIRRLSIVFLRDYLDQPSSLESCPATDGSCRSTLLSRKANIIANLTLDRYVLSWIEANTGLE